MTESLEDIERDLLNMEPEGETSRPQNPLENTETQERIIRPSEDKKYYPDINIPRNVKSCRYFFTGLPYDMTPEELTSFFKKFGTCDDIYYMTCRDGVFRGMAKATYHFLNNTTDIFEAFKNVSFNGMPLRVDYAMTREERKERKEAYNKIRLEIQETQEKIKQMTATEYEKRRAEYYQEYYNRDVQRRSYYERPYKYENNQPTRYVTRYEKLNYCPRPERINQYVCRFDPIYYGPSHSERQEERSHLPPDRSKCYNPRSRNERFFDSRSYDLSYAPNGYEHPHQYYPEFYAQPFYYGLY